MKKLALLLIPALLALSACKPTLTPVDPSSSGDLPSSESSSEEPEPIPTVSALLSFLSQDSYEYLVSQEEYHDEELKEATLSKVRKEGDVNTMFDVEFLEPADTGRREVEFDTFYFLHVEGDDTEVYYQVNGFWIFESISYGPKKAAKIFEAIEILGAVFDIIGDIEQGEDYDWSYSEEETAYHGHSKHNPGEATITLCAGFFSSIEVVMTDEEERTTYVSRIEASGHRTTHVQLPTTPVSEIYDAMGRMYDVLDESTSYTVERDIYVVEGDYRQHIIFYMVYDPDTEQLDVKAIINDSYVYYYRQTYDEGSYSYAYRAPATDWTPMTDEEFESAVSGAFEILNFVYCPRPDSLAVAMSELIECVPGSFSFKMGGVEEEDLRKIDLETTESCTYDPTTFAMKTWVEENAEMRRSYVVTNINNTIID